MKLKNLIEIIGDVSTNLKRMLVLSWRTDKKVTLGYYFTAILGAMAPLAASITLKFLIDSLIKPGTTLTIPIIVIVILAARYLIVLLESVILWGLNRVYFDYLFRYKVQNEINRRFYEKLSNLDIAHLEDAKTQNLISKVRDTMTWRPPNFLRMFSYFFGSIVGYLAAFFILLPFGWWIPIVITIATLPRLILRAKYGSIQWSIYGSGAPEVKRLWYLTWLLSTDTAIREMRIFQSNEALMSKLKQTQDYLFNLNKKPLDNYLRQLTFPPILETIILFVIAYLQLPNVLSVAVTIGSFTLLINMIDQLNSNVANAVLNFGEMYEDNLYVDDYFKILGLQKIITEVKNPVVIKVDKPPKIEFKNVFSIPRWAFGT